VSDDPAPPPLDVARLRAALEAELAASLPKLVERAMRRYLEAETHAPATHAPPTRVRRSSRSEVSSALLDELLTLAREETDALEQRLDLPFDQLLAVANGLDRTLAARLRRAKDTAEVRADIAAELRRRATRYDVFLTHPR
jgi:hypothetical protein